MNSKEKNSALSKEVLLEEWEKKLRETGVPLDV